MYPSPIYDPIPAPPPAAELLLDSRTVDIFGVNRRADIVQRPRPIQDLHLTVRRVMHVPDVPIQHLALQDRPVHLSPHVCAVVHVVLLRHVQLLMCACGHGCEIGRLPCFGVKIPFPVFQTQKIVDEFTVETRGR